MQRRQTSISSAGRWLFVIIVLGVVVFGMVNYLKPRPKILSPVSETKQMLSTSATVAPAVELETNSAGLTKVVQDSLSGTHGQYGIVVTNLKTGEKYERNSHQFFTPASMYKIWIMAIVYEQIEAGKMHLSDVINRDVDSLNSEFHISDDDAELTDGSFSFTVAQALQQMIVISHNYAALMLTDKVGLKTVVTFLKNNGLNESRVGMNGELPVTTPADMALFFEKLYDGKLANGQDSKAMMDLLKKQTLNYGLPKYLPETTEVAHKTGKIDDYTHDGGIVYSDSGNYIIVIMTKTDSTDLAEERMALVSKSVYEYFTKK